MERQTTELRAQIQLASDSMFAQASVNILSKKFHIFKSMSTC